MRRKRAIKKFKVYQKLYNFLKADISIKAYFRFCSGNDPQAEALGVLKLLGLWSF